MKRRIFTRLAVTAMMFMAGETVFASKRSKTPPAGFKDEIVLDEGSTGVNSESDFEFEVNDDFTEITITKYKGIRTNVEIPSTIQGIPVVRIGRDAFVYKKIVSVVIPEGVKELADYGVFSSRKELVSVSLPNDIYIGKKAFADCSSLQSIVIPKGCTLGNGAFEGCKELVSVSLPEDLKVIPNYCFGGCKKLSNITYPSTLKYIGSHAFIRCSFTSINIPEGIEFMGNNVFGDNPVTSIVLPKSLKYIALDLTGCDGIFIHGDGIDTISIPEGFSVKLLKFFNYNLSGEDFSNLRGLITGAIINKTIKLQKQIAIGKVTYVKNVVFMGTNRGKSSDFKYKGRDFIFTEEGKLLYDTLLSYGFSEKDAQEFCYQYSSNMQP